MSKQKQFTFKFEKGRFVNLTDVATDALTHEDSLKNYLIKKGYLVQNIQRIYYIRAIAAKANIPLTERLKLQKGIDEGPLQNVYKINPPKNN